MLPILPRMSDLLAAAEAELYEADPDGFTARRAELAASARDAGEPAAAKQITALRKPTRSAWVVNRLVRSDPGYGPGSRTWPPTCGPRATAPGSGN